MKKRLGCVSSVVALVLFTGTAASAQATAELAGRVSDESGGVLPGVTVAATQTDTGFTRAAVTDEGGGWVMPNMPTGPYRLEISLQGFRTYVQTGIVLQVGASPTINATLAVGSLEETVSVEAAAPIVDVRSAGISEVVDQERIVELPLQGRQVTDLIVLAGAAVETGRPNSRSFQGGVNISVAGGLTFGVAYLLDGAMHNDVQNAGGLPLPFPDALQEFRVATSALSAQAGMHSGASVNAVTKSGTNVLHGNAFEFLRDHRFNATSPFATIGADGRRVGDGLKRHQYGGTLGGPIVRDRLFFFAAYQGTPTRVTPTDNIAYVPTAQMLAGDFTAFASPACNNGRQITLRAPFVGNRIDPAQFSPAALNLARRLPATADPCGETKFALVSDRDEGQAVGRVDYQRSASHSIFGRYMYSFDQRPAPLSRSDNILATRTAGVDNYAQSLTLGDTRVFGANAVNSLRFAFNQTVVDRFNEDFFSPADLGVRWHNYSPTKEMVVQISGGFNISAATATRGVANNKAFQLSEDFTLVRGRHQIALGGNVAFWNSLQRQWATGGGNWNFNGSITGLGLADFLLGRVAVLEHGARSGITLEQLYQAAYVQDSWRATDRITVNAGLRWEPFFGQQILDGAIANFSRDNFRNGIRSAVFRRAPAGFLYPGDAGFPDGHAGFDTQWWNFSPRVGLAWDVTGDGRTAVRSSYGINYDFPVGETWTRLASGPPYGNRLRLQDPPGRMDNPYSHLPGGDPHPIVTGPDTEFPPFGAFGAVTPDINAPRVQSWNATVERQLGTDWGVSVSYLGSYSDRLWGLVSYNPGVFLGLGPCTIHGVSYPVCTTDQNLNNRRVLYLENPAEARFIANLDVFDDLSTENYRGLKLSVQRRAANGLSLNGNYTVSRCFGHDWANTGGTGGGYTNPADPAYDRGHCEQDRTHIANLTLGAQSPQLDGALLNAVASNWRVSGILHARSGVWLTVVTGRNSFNGIGENGHRVNQISDDVYGEKTLARFLNRAAFAEPAPGAFGNHVRNSIRGPNFWKVDVALSRLLAFGAAQTLEFRIEAFNLFNTFNWGLPNTNFVSGNFGRIQTQTGEPRIMQFGIKYGF